MEFKIGDKVKIKDTVNTRKNPLMVTIGRIGVIKDMSTSLKFAAVQFGHPINDFWSYALNDLELVEEKLKFSLSDIKERWLVKFRNSSIGMVDGKGYLQEIIDGKFVEHVIGELKHFNNDLTCKYSERHDIVEVYKPEYKTVWSRPVEETTIKIGDEEIKTNLTAKEIAEAIEFWETMEG